VQLASIVVCDAVVEPSDALPLEKAIVPNRLLPDWRVTPIEYKRGRPKKNDSDRVQLCAQALCLEEMLRVEIPGGAIYYGKRRRRTNVEFDGPLRDRTRTAAQRLLAMVRAHDTPRAVREPKCDSCSLIQLCLPDAMARSAASAFVAAELRRSLGLAGPTTDEVVPG
jgi:CRISPR-associated exonuclease Cas4